MKRRTSRRNPRRNAASWRESEVIARLLAGETISTYEQTADSGGWRLGATIHKLKGKGLRVESFCKKGFGRCAFYRLAPEDSRQPDIFGFPKEKPPKAGTKGGQ